MTTIKEYRPSGLYYWVTGEPPSHERLKVIASKYFGLDQPDHDKLNDILLEYRVSEKKDLVSDYNYLAFCTLHEIRDKYCIDLFNMRSLLGYKGRCFAQFNDVWEDLSNKWKTRFADFYLLKKETKNRHLFIKLFKDCPLAEKCAENMIEKFEFKVKEKSEYFDYEEFDKHIRKTIAFLDDQLPKHWYIRN